MNITSALYAPKNCAPPPRWNLGVVSQSTETIYEFAVNCVYIEDHWGTSAHWSLFQGAGEMLSEVLIVTRDPELRRQLAEILHDARYSLTATDATAPIAALPARLDCLLAIIDLSGGADEADSALQAIRRRAP